MKPSLKTLNSRISTRMSWLDIPRISVSRTDDDGDNGRWYPLRGHYHKSHSGVVITESNALKISAYWCGVRIISEAMASIELEVKKVSYNAEEQKVSHDQFGHPLLRLFNDEPNHQQNAYTFCDFMQLMLLNWGTAYAEIQRDQNDNLYALWPIHSSRVHRIVRVRAEDVPRLPFDAMEGDLIFMVRNDNGAADTPIHQRDMFWIAGPLSEDGITGKSTVGWMSETLGLAKAQDEHVGAFFKNGATPDIAIEIPGDPSPEKRSELRESWKRMHAGTKNAHEMLLLWGGMVPHTIGVNPNDAQLLQSRQFTVFDVARALKLPPHLLGALENDRKGTSEERSMDFMGHAMRPWIDRWRKSIRQQLLTPEEKRDGFDIRYNMRTLQAFDLKTLTEHIEMMSGIGVYNINEAREHLSMNPIQGGEVRLVKGNNLVPLEQAAKGTHKAAGSQKQE